MAKAKTFMDKIKKAQATGPSCPVCGEQVSYVKVVEAITQQGAPTRFNHRMVKLCKCNQKEVMGA